MLEHVDVDVDVTKCPLTFLPNFNITCVSEYRQLNNIINCPSNAAHRARINGCIYPKLKIIITFILTLLLKIHVVGSRGLDLQGHFVLDVKIGCSSNLAHFWR